MEAALFSTRWLQFAAAMVAGGTPLFFLYARAAQPSRGLVAGAGVVGAAASLAWLAAQAASFESDFASVADTGFGHAALARTLLFLLCGLGAVLGRWRIATTLGMAAAASFAWTGHGGMDEGAAGLVHRGSDIVHLISAAAWLGALVPLLSLALVGSRGAAEREAARTGMEAFSRIGVTVVGALVVSGLVNGWFLIGPDHLADLGASPYGQALLAKLALFAVMLGLAAANRFLITPALAREGRTEAVRASLIAETVLGALVLVAVAVLGQLAPPAHG